MGIVTNILLSKLLNRKRYGSFLEGDILILHEKAFEGVVYKTSIITEMGYFGEVDMYHGDLFLVTNTQLRLIKSGQVPVRHLNSGMELVFDIKFFKKAGKVYQVLYGN